MICDFGEGLAHPIAKSQIAPKSEIQRLGDRGILIITRYLADEAGLMPFARAQSRWALVPVTWQVLRELNVKLPQDDPARAIVNGPRPRVTPPMSAAACCRPAIRSH